MNRKALEFEIIVKAILALFVLVIMIAILYTFAVVKSGGGMKVIIDDITGQGDGVLSRIGQLFGSGCKDGTTKCGMSSKVQQCVEGKWEATDEAC